MADNLHSLQEEVPGRDDDGSSCWKWRVEIDTSAPFVSVKEAVDHFGGKGHWKQQLEPRKQTNSENTLESSTFPAVEEQVDHQVHDLIVNDGEGHEVLNELEVTKTALKGLRLELQEETSLATMDNITVCGVTDTENKAKNTRIIDQQNGLVHYPDSILVVLKEAQSNLGRMVYDLNCIQSSIERLQSKLQKEEISPDETHQRLALNSTEVIKLEHELDQARLMLQLIKEAGACRARRFLDEACEVGDLSDDLHQFKEMAEAAETEASKLAGGIERGKSGIMSSVIRLHPVDQEEKAAYDPEAAAAVEISALLESANSKKGSRSSTETYLSFEDCTAKKVDTVEIKTNTQVPEVMEEEATEEKVEGHNKMNTAVREAIFKWLLETEHGSYSIRVSPLHKFFHGLHTIDPSMEGIIDQSMDYYGHSRNPESALSPVLSIGQILKRKLVGPSESQISIQRNHTDMATLGQLLRKKHGFSFVKRDEGDWRQFGAKRRRFGFRDISSILATHQKEYNKKKRRQS